MSDISLEIESLLIKKGSLDTEVIWLFLTEDKEKEIRTLFRDF